MNTPLTRDGITTIVTPHVVMVGQFQSVPYIVAEDLIGPLRMARLLHDPLRNLGPRKGTVYPWNVVDFIQHPNLRAEHDARFGISPDNYN